MTLHPQILTSSHGEKSNQFCFSRLTTREELDKEQKKAAFWKAQSEGKTDQAKSDMARLLIIRKQREEAARKRTEDQDSKVNSQREDSINAGRAIISKTLGK